MKLLKFYGRTLNGALGQVRRQLGADALIVTSIEVEADSPTERMHPGTRFEITAAREETVVEPIRPGGYPDPKIVKRAVAKKESAASEVPAQKPNRTFAPSLIEDLGDLKSQIRDLLSEVDSEVPVDVRDQTDLADYRFLTDQGIDHKILAPSFRRWLHWRTAKNSAVQTIKGGGFREWLWNEWKDLTGAAEAFGSEVLEQPRIQCVIGANGVGKSTTLAKMASKLRQNLGKSVAIVSFDSQRFGANEQWNRYAKLMGIDFMPIVSQEELARCIEQWDRFDWIGIDLPGSATMESDAGKLYGALLARDCDMRTSLVLDSLNQDEFNAKQIKSMQPFKPDNLIFSKLDLAESTGGLINLTMPRSLPIDSLATGTKVPEDLESADADAVWRWVFESADIAEESCALAEGAV